MARNNHPDDTVKVRDLPASRKGVQVGKPRKITTTSGFHKTAYPATGSTMGGSGGNFYSPELSTDFLELPQSLDERRSFYRFFYDNHPYIGQAIDLHVDLPLSKVRLAMPVARNRELAERSMRFCERWADNIDLLQRLMEISHEYHLLGEAIILCEDKSPEMPRDVREQLIREITAEGEATEKWETYPDADDREVAWLKKNYFGWTSIWCLNPDNVHIETFQCTEEKLIEMLPDSKTKAIINRADSGDLQAIRIVNSMPQDLVQSVREGVPLALNTDPDAGTFVTMMSRKRSQYAERGQSILQRCLLPGTPIWIKRAGIIQQIAVEDVNDQTDLLLTHKGRFCPCIAGSRPVSEEVTVLDIEGIEDTLKLTSDHLVLRIQEDGTEEWVEARNLQKGDLVREAHVVPEKDPITEIDLADWWKGRSLNVVKRGRPKLGLAQTDRQLSVSDVKNSESGLAVQFSYPNDNRNRTMSSPGMSKILAWANSLTEPLTKPYLDVAQETGIPYRDLRSYVPKLRKEGLLRTEARSLGRGRGQQVTWFPSEKAVLPDITITQASPVSKLQITEDFCYLLGTWLGDGCVWTDHESPTNVDGLGWTLHDKYPEVRDKILVMISKCLPESKVESGIFSDMFEDGCCSIQIKDPLLGHWFLGEFGHTAQGKHLPEWFFGLPEGHLLAFLGGVLDTDGWLAVDKAHRIELTLDNKLLIDQLHILCNRLGFKTQTRREVKPAHEWARQWKTKKGLKTKVYKYDTKTYWLLVCYQSEDVRRWATDSAKGSLVDWPVRGVRQVPKIIGGQLVRKVEDILHESYAGPVYSFAVAEDESHITGGVLTHNCLRTLTWQDKVRQATTSIASRHMTPFRLIWAEDMNDEQTEELRDQVDLALQDPDYSIVSSFEVHWEEMGSEQRLPDWSWVWELTDKHLYAGLGVTESLLSGESSYSGDRIHLEVINVRYLLLRELFQKLVERYFFKPMCRRMGFVEEDEDGVLQVLVPRLSFTRLALRDTQETYDALLNLYTKGSLEIDVILELLNIDPVTTAAKLKKDVMTQNDALYNEFLRGMYSAVGSAAVEQSDVIQKMVEGIGLTFKPKEEEGGSRF